MPPRRGSAGPRGRGGPALRAAALIAGIAGAALLFGAGQSATPAEPHFVDIAPRSKFTYTTNNDFSQRKYFNQTICGGVAILDYDGDGRMDIFFTNGSKLPELRKTGPEFHNCLLRNRGDGTFEDVTAKAGLTGARPGNDLGYNLGVSAADYDNDGHPDLFVCGAGRNALYHNSGDGTFTDVTAGSGIVMPRDTLSVGAAWFDYDNDGLLDLIVSNYTTWSPQSDKRCTLGGSEVYCDPEAYYSNASHRLYHNLGHGKFEDVTDKSGIGKAPGKGMGISIADFNDDGLMDVFIANDTEPNALFINKGDGTFEEMALRYGVALNEQGNVVSSMGSDARDFDNDGRVDIVYNDLINQVWHLFLNRGDIFRYASPQTHLTRLSTPYSGWSIGFIDYDNDGWLDLYSANGDVDDIRPDARMHDTMFRNIGGKAFEDVSAPMGPDFLRKGFQRGSAFADLNNDGFQDIVVTSLNERPRVLMNTGGNGNHWLTLELTGHVSNRDAIGAKVKVTCRSGRTLYQHVAPSVGFISSSDKRVHFGLGQEQAVETIEIHWPSGLVQRIDDPGRDRFLRIDEPQRKAPSR